MTQIPGTNISDKIVPNDTNDTFPTHVDTYGKGGFRSVETIIERNSISSERRKEGMIVNVIDENNKIYQLKDGITNSNWSTISFQSSGSYISNLDELGDVVLSSLKAGQVLTTDGVNWFNTDPISGTSFQGTIELNPNVLSYTIFHDIIESLNINYPILSLQIPTSGDDLLVVGVTNRTLSSFDIVLSQIPNTSGYFVNWSMGGNVSVQNNLDNNSYTLLTTTQSISGDLQSLITQNNLNVVHIFPLSGAPTPTTTKVKGDIGYYSGYVYIWTDDSVVVRHIVETTW